MKNEALTYGLGGALVGGFLVWVITMTTFNSNNTNMMQMMGYKTTTQKGMMQNPNTIDQHFIEQMIPHHEDAITMAKLALVKSDRPELRSLSENIISSQSLEIDQMKEWYKKWFGKEVSISNTNKMGMMGKSGINMGMMGNESDINRLENAEDFDREFLEQMIPHHQMAVMMANMLKSGTQRSEMKKLAEDIITAQTDEINQMREWLKSW